MAKGILLLDLPTFPKGVLSLSLLSVAGCLRADFDVKIIDLNIDEFDPASLRSVETIAVGMKVTSQNFLIAKELSDSIKSMCPQIKIVWGGEFPTLMPDMAMKYADSVFCGLFEPLAAEFIADLKINDLKEKYTAAVSYAMDIIPLPDFSLVSSLNAYSSFMGLPMETSRGCTEKCSFCMVHVMQKKSYQLKSIEQLQSGISAYDGQYINIVDYNFGVDKEHMMQVAEMIRRSGALGWMAEMCIELLDDDDLLQALGDSRCKMIYCGLESIDDMALQSVHKMNTNHIENYERIIRKVQSYGIQIAAGMILGIANTKEETFQKTLDFFQRMGLIYAKLTFLTYNPGTKVQKYMERKGTYVTNKIEEYDGLRMSYLPLGIEKEVVISGAEYFIRKFYSLSAIVGRSYHTKLNLIGRFEFILFSYCYGKVYHEWLRNDFLRRPERFDILLLKKFKKSISMILAEKILYKVRRQAYRFHTHHS